MTDIPIIFSAPMVQALLREAEAPGTGKTMTRRLAWRTRKTSEFVDDRRAGEWAPTPWQRVRPGDRLWVRETWREDASEYSAPGGHVGARRAVLYRAGHDCADELKWASPIHLARADSRLTLVVTAAKIERLQEISEADARAEGIEWRDGCFGTRDREGRLICGGSPCVVEAFRCLWINLHGPGAWDADPEVVALTFAVHKQNIDGARERAA